MFQASYLLLKPFLHIPTGQENCSLDIVVPQKIKLTQFLSSLNRRGEL